MRLRIGVAVASIILFSAELVEAVGTVSGYEVELAGQVESVRGRRSGPPTSTTTLATRRPNSVEAAGGETCRSLQKSEMERVRRAEQARRLKETGRMEAIGRRARAQAMKRVEGIRRANAQTMGRVATPPCVPKSPVGVEDGATTHPSRRSSMTSVIGNYRRGKLVVQKRVRDTAALGEPAKGQSV